MADKELNNLTEATTPLDGTEWLYVLQGGNSRKVATGDVGTGGGGGGDIGDVVFSLAASKASHLLVGGSPSSQQTIGNASSGADHASDDYEDLYALLANRFGNSGETWGSNEVRLLPPGGTVIMMAGSSHAVGTMGGAETVSATGSVSNSALSIAQLAAHTHKGWNSRDIQDTGSGANVSQQITLDTNIGSAGSGSTHTHSFTGSASSVMQPFSSFNGFMRYAA